MCNKCNTPTIIGWVRERIAWWQYDCALSDAHHLYCNDLCKAACQPTHGQVQEQADLAFQCREWSYEQAYAEYVDRCRQAGVVPKEPLDE